MGGQGGGGGLRETGEEQLYQARSERGKLVSSHDTYIPPKESDPEVKKTRGERVQSTTACSTLKHLAAVCSLAYLVSN